MKMIKLHDNSDNFISNYTYCDHFPRQSRNIVLLLNHYSEDKFADQMLEKLLSEIIQLDLESLPEAKIIPVLQEFFVEINWRFYSRFSQRPDLERGISLFLGVMEADRMYLVQFGRYFLGMVGQSEFTEIGRKWENLAVASQADIQLLGNHDIDISVKVEQITIPEDSYFLAIESKAAMKLRDLGLHYMSLNEHLSQVKEDDQFGFAIIRHQEQKAHNTNPWIRRKRVNRTATILLIIIILSAAYVYYGKNLIDDILSRLKFTGNEFTRNDIKEQFFVLQEQAQDLLNDLANEDMNITIFPQQKIEMEADWEMSITEDFSSTPCFDYRRLYAASGKLVYGIDKQGAVIKWEKKFSAKVEVLRLVDANRILVSLADDRLLCLNRDNGESIWEKEFKLTGGADLGKGVSQISLNQYRQLDDSVFLTSNANKLTLSQVRSGEMVSEYTYSDAIDNISDYDVLEKCIYITSGRKLKKINIKVMT
jgi:PQQ-like domain